MLLLRRDGVRGRIYACSYVRIYHKARLIVARVSGGHRCRQAHPFSGTELRLKFHVPVTVTGESEKRDPGRRLGATLELNC